MAMASSPDGRRPDEQVGGGEMEEWLRQLNEGNLSQEQIRALAVEVLRRQADQQTKWNTLWGKFVELAHRKERLPATLWRDYLLGAVQIQFSVASEAKRSEGLPFWIEHQPARTGGDGPDVTARGWLEDDLSGIPLHVKPENAREIHYTRLSLSVGSGSGCGRTLSLTNSRFPPLKPGPQTYHYRYHVEVFEGSAHPDQSAEAQPLGERTIEGTIPWRLLAEDAEASLPSLRADESLRVPIKESFRVQYALRDVKDTTLVQVMVQADHPSTGMAFNMSVRAGDETWPLGPVAWAKDQMGWWAYDTDLPEGIKEVDIVLTPSAVAAGRLKRDNPYRLIRLNEIWDGAPIILPQIRIGSQEISMCKIPRPSPEAARDYVMEQFEQTDPVVRELKTDRDWQSARAQLERRVRQHPEDLVAVYDLGCMALADGDLAAAMQRFAELGRRNVSESLRRQTQRQLRRLCARYLYEATDEHGVAAMCALGRAYERGWGVKQSFQDAKHWYRSAGNAGNAEAMCRLAAMYEHETGATVHTEEAHEWYRNQTLEWYRKAADLGNQEAKQWLSTHHLN